MTLRIIAGTFKGRLLKTPKNGATRPTQGMLRGAVFNICQNQIEKARFLDLFAGSGAMGFEAISRGAVHVTLVENQRQAIACIKENMKALHVESQVSLFTLDALQALKFLSTPFDLIYIDPPYDTPTHSLFEELLKKNLFAPHATLFLEERRGSNNPSPPFQSPHLLLKSSRHFGAALLHQYQFIE